MKIVIKDLNKNQALDPSEMANIRGGVMPRTITTRDGKKVVVDCTGVVLKGSRFFPRYPIYLGF